MQLTLRKEVTWYYPVCNKSKVLFKFAKRKAIASKDVKKLTSIGIKIVLN